MFICYPEMLYIAPEYLRSADSKELDEESAKQARDVYAFAIIMQELALRNLPFALERQRKPIVGKQQRTFTYENL